MDTGDRNYSELEVAPLNRKIAKHRLSRSDYEASRTTGEFGEISLSVDRSALLPIHLQLRHQIMQYISSGRLQAGAQLPSVRQLAASLGIAVATVQRSYGELGQQGLIIGEPGRGVYVADVTVPRSELSNQQSMLKSILSPVLQEARLLGFNSADIISCAHQILDAQTAVKYPPIVLFVGQNSAMAERYQTYLRESLAGFARLTITTIDELEKNEATIMRAGAGEVSALACLVPLLGRCRAIGIRNSLPTYGVVVELTEDTQHDLMRVHYDAKLGILSEPEFVESSRALVAQFTSLETAPLIASIIETTAVQRIIATCTHIVHTSSVASFAHAASRPTMQLIELRFRPASASAQRLRESVSKLPWQLAGDDAASESTTGV